MFDSFFSPGRILTGLLLVLGILAGGCGGGTADSQGTYHPPEWLASHPGKALADLDRCALCHATTVLKVGSGIPGCMATACHHGTLPDFAQATVHGLRAKAAQDDTGGGLASCALCHGSDFLGGGSGVACSSCHGVPAPHPPKPWRTTGSTHTATKPSNAAICARCHYPGSPVNPADHPATPAAAGTVPSCFNNTLCHGPKGQASHPVPYLGADHFTATPATFASGCSTCHAVTGTSPTAAAPLCTTCHQAGSPLTVTACASCHGALPGGTVFPDVAGSHAVHDALAGVTGQCDTCHTGYASGTGAHYDHANARSGKDSLRVAPAPTGFATLYDAQAGAAAFASATLTCSNVSCHGALATPNWRTGTLDAAAETSCRLCHSQGTAQGSPEGNSWYSGRHAQHLGGEIGAACTDCHAMGNGTPGALAHFAHLDTLAMEGPASDTIQVGGSRTVYNPTARTCTLTCHGQHHNSNHW